MFLLFIIVSTVILYHYIKYIFTFHVCDEYL